MVGLRRRHLIAAANPGAAASVSASATLNASDHANRPIKLTGDGSTLQAYTLPLATGSGNTYTFYVQTTNTGTYTITAAGSDEFNGTISGTDSDGEAEGPGWPALAADNFSVVTLGDVTRGELGS